MSRAILASLAMLAAGVCQAQDDWSYPVDPYFGVLHASEYPGDEFPIDVNTMPRTVASSSLIRMGDPDTDWTYWPEPTYYWWDALTGPGVLHGAWQSTAMARNVRECPAAICTQTYSPDDAGGFIEFVFADTTQNVRIRLVRYDGEEDVGGFQVGSYWREALSTVPRDAFIPENGAESDDCGIYESPLNATFYPCRVYQVVIPPVANANNVLYGRCHHGVCNVLKVSSTTDAVTYYPGEPAAGEGSGPSGGPASGASNSPPVLVTAIGDMSATEDQAFERSVAEHFADTDGDSLTYSASGLPGSLSFEAATGLIRGTPIAADAGMEFKVTITATDTAGQSVSDAFRLSVAAAPQAVQPNVVVQSSGGGGSLGPFGLLLMALVLFRPRRRDRAYWGSMTMACGLDELKRRARSRAR